MASKRVALMGALILAAAAAPALAADGMRAPTIGDLDRVQGQIVMAKAQLELANAQQSLKKLRGEEVVQQAPDAPPVVTGVFGPANSPYARFAFADGSQQTARPGDLLAGDYRVVTVSVERVVIVNSRGRKLEARFARSAPAAEASPGSSAAGGDVYTGAPRPGVGLPPNLLPGTPIPARNGGR